jgi:F0F1-type ATP synthase assembly protein I
MKNTKKKISLIPKTNPYIFRELAPYMNLGMQILIPILLGALGGWWMDKKFETIPIFILVFTILGVIIGMYSFFRTISELEKKKKRGN